MNNFVNVLTKSRENIVNILRENNSYDYLVCLFNEINNDVEYASQKNTRLHDILIGKYENNKYINSSIELIPSEELIDGIISLAREYNIQYIEEINTGMGILSSLMKIKDSQLEITASDTFNNINTCYKLGLFPIAKRSAYDFKYYKILNEKIPEMIISSYYHNNFTSDTLTEKCEEYMNDINDLLKNNNHKIIILLFPHTLLDIYKIIGYYALTNKYKINSFYVKAVDKYFFVNDIFNNFYKSGIIAHIFIRNDIYSLKENNSIEEIFQPAIIPHTTLDTYCVMTELYHKLFTQVSLKIFKFMQNKYSIMPINKRTKYKLIDTCNTILSKSINVPSYIHDDDELIQWTSFTYHNLYFDFNSRQQFYQFSIDILPVYELSNKKNFPQWVNTYRLECVYVYMKLLNKIDSSIKSSNKMMKIFEKINDTNKEKLTKQ